MKKGYVLLVILIVLVLMAGCTNEVKTKRSNDSSPIPAAQTGDSVSPPSGGSSGGVVDGSKDTTEKSPGESKGAEVIVKSGSDVASKDKAELLNQIDQELDHMINDINNLEDISDSDLQ